MASYDRLDFYKKNRDYSVLDNHEQDVEDDFGEGEGEFRGREQYEHEEYEEEYDQNEDGGEDYHGEEYEGENQGEEPEEDPAIAREAQEYLERRERMKEQIRQKLRREARNLPSSNDKQDRNKKFQNNDFGSFFGPSQPVIARRVIEEARAMTEASHAATKAKVAKEIHKGSRPVASVGAFAEKKEISKVVKPSKSKAQQLKESRDYSFLFSDDADVPELRKLQKPETKKPMEHNQSSTRFSGNVQRQQSAQTPLNVQQRKLEGKALQSKPTCVPTKQKPVPSASKPAGLSNDNTLKNKQIINKSSGGGLPVPRKATTPEAMKMMSKKGAVMASNGIRKDINGVKSNPQSKMSALKTQLGKPLQKPIVNGVSKSVVRPDSKMALKTGSRPASGVSNNLPNNQQKQRMPQAGKGGYDDDDDVGDYRAALRKLTGYDPRRYRDEDEDDDDAAMEAGFDDIQEEEFRSARIAKKEDEEQLALIEAEERAERLRKLKKRKLHKAA